ncbi:MAG: TMEM175 family protein [Furfurilactobacillus sp.]|jgi:uncharacterized membrane protein|uniref:TMEM175 family protein n=1 Tax=Furfurilactobacillus milii TaxID=2888272 RepID=A0ABT6D7T7_9LACO|nr:MULTISPECIES: TMEM175 family protein [Furfurilactobacillus]QLE65852.1 Integral membrane protein [Furfurilactobacillus rossiae]MCF6160239.1 TMEM175 family protein [Furfurilactobacillus milii]MCF6162182.1 TMEM175 family protein [Furfurilactobacillus milii]MCF6420503.1 TMEM175 family protein [Furfurilactobacillus milii]MCH4012373.1 TMEM175 family protein [Furfurilactobacillus sp.]
MNKSRVEAFIDAIIAIVLTVLILEIKVPDEPSLKMFFSEWRMAFSYLMTFILVMFSWYVQHGMFLAIKRVKLGGFIGVCVWLFVLSFLPVTTAFVGRYPSYWGAELVYLMVALLWLLSAQLMSFLIIRENRDVPEMKEFIRRQAGSVMLTSNIIWTVVATALIFVIPEIGMLTPIVTVIIQIISNRHQSRQLSA